MIQIYDEPAEAIKTAHKKGKKLTSSQVFGIITVKEFQEHELLKNLDGYSQVLMKQVGPNKRVRQIFK